MIPNGCMPSKTNHMLKRYIGLEEHYVYNGLLASLKSLTTWKIEITQINFITNDNEDVLSSSLLFETRAEFFYLEQQRR